MEHDLVAMDQMKMLPSLDGLLGRGRGSFATSTTTTMTCYWTTTLVTLDATVVDKFTEGSIKRKLRFNEED